MKSSFSLIYMFQKEYEHIKCYKEHITFLKVRNEGNQFIRNYQNKQKNSSTINKINIPTCSKRIFDTLKKPIYNNKR
ncbi:hypothetical protein AK88_04147 [Plasmodium fragile]|uniref:Uncharacterized protein n=1 Tax=Plasmodium fragile TaxID=5857 RepID=A0A0D9QKD8_PLAFR|nr:uncharacterized protein AK88_04147 [Plasmodium fragile]KJP86176.1 hypothetical protein AK88_04147 [Plasmodium fragile]